MPSLDITRAIHIQFSRKKSTLSHFPYNWFFEQLRTYVYSLDLPSLGHVNDKIIEEFNLVPEIWEQAIYQLEWSLEPNHDMVNTIRDLKATYPLLRVHAFFNISSHHFDYLKPIIDKLDIFETVVSSASIGCRMPGFDSYRILLDRIVRIGAEACASVLVGDVSENVLTAQALGIRGILFDNASRVITRLHNIFGDPVARGMDFLRRHSKDLFCETSRGVVVKDNLSQLLILQCIGDRLVLSTIW
ncbi:hypothetical protein HIM_00303 [Hirsutella minnesotensis 3608]|nr:hypothetical protein HIM_00303 [Hirsutella minnesotensis 3608]